MQFAISQIMIIVLLIHAALGCCWHHAHECVSSCCDSPTAVAKVYPCESHQHEERSHGQHDDGMHSKGKGHHHEHDCNGDHCTFVRSDRSPEESGEYPHDEALLLWTNSTQQGCLVCPKFVSFPDPLSPVGMSSLRSHLLLSILLI